MKRKARIQTGIDDRLVAIYARKSRITNKGDSIGVQFKQSADYAVNQLSLPEDYEFARYEDKGLSGYYSDRPDFQRLLRDIEMGKIKAVACYKLDRISRKTSDLMRLLEYFERHDVTLLVCSNNINTRISTSKIIIQVLAIIAEFERDILTERIQDNLMELAKDGRWLGGKTPTGFSSQRVTTGSGKNKSAISFLVPVQEEKEIVLEIYGTFWETRSLLQTANIINEKYETKHGAKFTTSTIRLILRNPIYCVADEYSYNYFLEHDGNLFGEPSDFDGQHGLTAYNKTDQMKVEDEDSTFFNPKFSQLLTRKPISEWIVSVGRHEGFISSRKWVETQNMLDEIAEKYNRPHRKTNALLSGLMYCPICGKRLRVLPESNRWTNGKPRFKYACPGVRAKECTFKGVEGVTLDEFVIHSLSSLQEEHSDYYRQLLENRVASMIRTDQSEKEYQETKKAIERLNADIAAQVRNLREADDALKRFIQDDIKELTDELAKREAALRRMEDTQSENQYLTHELNGMKKRLLSFEEFAKDAQPEALFTLVHSIVDRIYITTDGTKQKCQVYIKGCATEDYSDVLGAAGYIEEEPLLPVVSYMPPMCDLDYYSIVHHSVSKFQILRFRPEQHFPALGLAHIAYLGGGVGFQLVVPDCMVENGAQLIVERFQVDRRVGLAVLVPVVEHFALPCHDLFRANLAHFPLAEIRHQLLVEDMLFRPPGVLLDTAFHVRSVEGHETLKGHVQVGGLLLQECPFPLQRLPLGLEAPFHLLFLFPRPVLKVKGRIPCAFGLVFVCWHFVPSLLIFPQSIELFLEVVPAHPSGDGEETFLLQFLVHLPHQLVGVGLGDTQHPGHFLGPYKQFLAHVFTSLLLVRKIVNAHVLIIHSHGC